MLSTGIGTDNVEIIINEVHILKEYNYAKFEWRLRAGDAGADAVPAEELFDPSRIKIIRVGTCGSPNDKIEVGMLAITRHSIGMDNTCQYYDPPAVNGTPDVQEVLAKAQSTGLGKIQIHATKAAPEVTSAIAAACDSLNADKAEADKQRYYIGTTCSASGFYGCQGRSVGRFRGHITVPQLTEEMGDLRFNLADGSVERVANFEMETSAVSSLSAFLGYQAGAVCVVIARRTRTERAFATAGQGATGLANAIVVGLDAVTSME